MDRTGFTDRLATLLARRRGWAIAVVVAMTALLTVPFLTMTPDGTASDEPGGPVFEARDAIDERFHGGVQTYDVIVEARDGDILDKPALQALHARIEVLRTHPELGPLLVDNASEEIGRRPGAVTIADIVRERLGENPDEASAEEWRAVASAVVDQTGPAALGLSVKSERDEQTGLWTAPATVFSIQTDSQAVEAVDLPQASSESEVEEHVGRDIQEVLRASDELDAWGIAIDQDLTAAEQGEAAGPFIGLTVFAILLLVGITFRSYWVLAVTGAGLISLLVWLNGLANLIGMEEHQILSTVVPIAMLAFGVDYAFHAVGRYRESRASGDKPVRAYGKGMSGVSAALGLALATGGAAFLANTASGIESIVQFGITATIGLLAAFVLLGYIVPLVLAWIDERLGEQSFRWSRSVSLVGGVGAAAFAMTVVLLLVFIAPVLGLALAPVYALAFIVLPLLLATRLPARFLRSHPESDGPTGVDAGPGRLPRLIGRIVVGLAVRRRSVIPTVAALTLIATVFAVQVPASFDVEDFFAQDTDFVVGLEKVDEHVGTQGGEAAEIYVEGDLSNPDSVAAIERFVDRVEALDSPLMARDGDGDVRVEGGVLAFLDAAEGTEGSNLLAEPGDVERALRTGADTAVPEGGGQATMTAREVAQIVAPVDDELTATRLQVRLVGSREQQNIEQARDLLEPIVADLERDLQAESGDATATLTGAPIVRQASMDAVARAMQVSLPIALVVCFLLTSAFMRSVRYALIASGSIVLVAAWLYGFMFLAGYSVNLVTATIGALSIGIGIDFATHFTMRYREELAARGDKLAALEETAQGTGMALVGSTLSSAVGFAILAFAPMPMFASFGVLTALMVVFALAASLLVLPGLLVIAGRRA